MVIKYLNSVYACCLIFFIKYLVILIFGSLFLFHFPPVFENDKS